MHSLTQTFLDQKWQFGNYCPTWKYCIGACNIFAWIVFIWIWESSGIFGGIFRPMEIGFPFVGGENDLKVSIIRARVSEEKPKHRNYCG